MTLCYRGRGKPDLEGHKRGQYAAAIMRRGLKGQGWKLVVCGHSLGAGVAALLSLKLRHSFAGTSGGVPQTNQSWSRSESWQQQMSSSGKLAVCFSVPHN